MCFVVACSRCQTKLTDETFARFADAEKIARELGYPSGEVDYIWCGDCALAEPHLDPTATPASSAALSPIAV